MPFGQTQEERDNYTAFDTRIEQWFGSRFELGKLEAEVTGAGALDETDRQTLLGRINQYLLDMDKSDAMNRDEDLMVGGSDENAG